MNDSLAKIAKGSMIGFVGYVVATGGVLLARLLVARLGSEANYGVFSVAFVVLNIVVLVATLGLDVGASRNIAFSESAGKSKDVQYLILSTIKLCLLASAAVGIVLFFSADLIAKGVFHEINLGLALKILAFGIPSYALIYVLAGVFRGFNDVKPQVIFRDIIRNLLFALFLLPLFFFRVPWTSVFYTWLASLIITFIAIGLYTAKRLPFTTGFVTHSLRSPEVRGLLFFSIPLLGIMALQTITTYTDTLMLAIMKSSTVVGLYNAAWPLAIFVETPQSVLLNIYLPVISGQYAQNAKLEIRRNFAILTKWVCACALPLCLILFLYPEQILTFFFGSSFAAASDALRILSVGYMLDVLLGPNGATLIAMGQLRFMLFATIATVILNVVLNFALIPRLAMEGAAIATAVSITSVNLLRIWRLYSLMGLMPLSRNLVKPTLLLIGIVALYHFSLTTFTHVTTWMLPLIFISYYVIYGLSMLLTRSIEKEDISILRTVAERFGIILPLSPRNR